MTRVSGISSFTSEVEMLRLLPEDASGLRLTFGARPVIGIVERRAPPEPGALVFGITDTVKKSFTVAC